MAHKKPFNDYKICGETTIIYLKRRTGEVLECLIDTEDLDRIKNLNLHWYSMFENHTKSYYSRATKYLGKIDGKYRNKIHFMNKEIMREFELFVDHINHNTLDNRKENLRVVENKENTKHRKGANSNNSIGYRNVSCINDKYVVQIQVNGKNTVVGKFNDVKEAGEFAEKMRMEHYGEFAGNS